jgi:translocation and assembly module TamB
MARAPRRRRWLFTVSGAALAVGGAVVALGPAAPWVVDHLADGQRVWRLGSIVIDGVSGTWLGDLHVDHLSLADASGVWLEAEKLTLNWRPQDLAFGAVRLDRGHAERLTILRQPVLLQRRRSVAGDPIVRVGDLRIETIVLSEAVLGEPAQFNAQISLDLGDKALLGLDLSLHRTDSNADRLDALYRPQGAVSLDIQGAPGGVFARALGVPGQSVRASAEGAAGGLSGNAHWQASIGDSALTEGAMRWTPTHWSADASAQLDLLPRLRTLARRLGPNVSLHGSGESEGAFNARAETTFFSVELVGALDDAHTLDGPAHFVATTSRLSAIARESPFTLGAARLEGELRRARGTIAIRANLDANQLDVFGARARLIGPLRAALTQEMFTLEADLRAPDDSPHLFAQARLKTEMAYDRTHRRYTLDRAELTSDALAVDAQGWANGADGEFAGAWRVRRLGALARDLTGEASGAWRTFTEPSAGRRAWTTTLSGAGANIAGEPSIVPQLLGPAPRFDARLHNEHGGITVSHIRLDGAKMRAGAAGRIVRGQADLTLEASARGPLFLGEAQIAGGADATGRLTGRLARPTLSARASLSSFAAAGVTVEQPIVDVTLAPEAHGYSGHAQLHGTALGQTLTASSAVAVDNTALTLTALDGQLGALQAQGSARITARGVSAELDVNGALDGLVPGVSGRVAGTVSLMPQALRVDAQIADARVGELRMRAMSLHAEGPFDAIAARFDLRGRLGRAPLVFVGTGALDASGGGAALSIEGRGSLAGADIFTRAPMRARWADRVSEASLNVAVAGGVVLGQWRERGRALSGAVEIEAAPLAPLAAIWDERASGQIDGRISLANAGGGLTGQADVTLLGARFAGRQRGTLDMHIVGDLDPGRLTATLDAASTEGLSAHFEADAPVVTSAAPIYIALAPERRGRARWSVRGPAESLWTATRLQDQLLEGQLNGEGELEFGAGYLSGDGHIEISDGRFEDKLSAVALVDLDARLAVDQRGVTIERFSARGPRGGRLTATGGSANPREGRIALTVDDMRIVNRPDARASASGELTLTWEGLHSTLSGAINIIEAEIDVATNPEAGIPTLDVIEINRQGEADEDRTPSEAPRRNGSTALDVGIRAPGRVFTRGRGVDAEWLLDLRLSGTASSPRLYGDARAIRGTLALSGQPFEIEDARIFFNGDPLDAQIDLTAQRDTADLTARIRLTGTARDPEVTFSSEPALPEDEILPQVLFGRSVADLSAFEAAQLAASLAALSGRASLDLVDAARAAAGLDRFNVRQDEDGGFLVAGGVYLTREVYVEVARTGLGQAQTRVEWTVRPRLVLITSFLGNGDQRVSLRWRRESD